MIVLGLPPVCGRGDCDQPAVVRTVWRSASRRRWTATACATHADPVGAPVAPVPGFELVSEVRFEVPA